MHDINFSIYKESPTFLEFFASRIYKLAFFYYFMFCVGCIQSGKKRNK